MIKICRKCKIEKDISNFSKHSIVKCGLSSVCKECNKLYRINNKEKINKYTLENKEKLLEYSKNYRKDNKEYFNKWKDENNSYYYKYHQENKKRLWILKKERLKTDSLFAFKCRIRALVCISIRKRGYTKKSKTSEYLGCSYEFFKEYIEAQFTSEMNWDNIHLDHIKPMSSAKTEKEVLELNHYTNFQPLLAIDNLIKNNSLIEKQLRFL